MSKFHTIINRVISTGPGYGSESVEYTQKTVNEIVDEVKEIAKQIATLMLDVKWVKDTIGCNDTVILMERHLSLRLDKLKEME